LAPALVGIEQIETASGAVDFALTGRRKERFRPQLAAEVDQREGGFTLPGFAYP
jgi:hypothetical protein